MRLSSYQMDLVCNYFFRRSSKISTKKINLFWFLTTLERRFVDTLNASLSFAVIGGILGFIFLIASLNKHTFSKKIYHKERDDPTNMEGGEQSGNSDSKLEVETI